MRGKRPVFIKHIKKQTGSQNNLYSRKSFIILFCIVLFAGCKEKNTRYNTPGGKPSVRANDSCLSCDLPLMRHVYTAAAKIALSDSKEALGDMHRFEIELDSTCAVLKQRSATTPHDTTFIEIINTLLYSQWGITMDTSTNTVQNIFPHTVIKNKRGSCLGITLLYLLVAARVGFPLQAVVLPGHIYLTYRKNGSARNIEPNKLGIHHPTEYYTERYDGAKAPWYRREPLTEKEVAGLFYYALSTVFLKEKDAHTAKYFLYASIACFPELYTAWGNLGLVYSLLGNYDSSGIALYTAAALNPDDPQLWYNIATVESSQNKFIPAIEAYQKGLKKDPANLPLLYGIAYAYFKANKGDSAALYIKKLEINGDTSRRTEQLKQLILRTNSQ